MSAREFNLRKLLKYVHYSRMTDEEAQEISWNADPNAREQMKADIGYFAYRLIFDSNPNWEYKKLLRLGSLIEELGPFITENGRTCLQAPEW